MKGHHIHAAVAYRHGTLTTSAEAAAAYRHAQRHGNGPDAFDYRGKVGVAWVGIVAPDEVPDWMRDSETLWRAVDASETRVNARLAQEVVIGLPHQVDLAEHITMLTAFAKRCCVDPHKLIADIAIHAPPVHRGGDPRHWHAHILLTDRPAGADGFARTKDRRTSDKDFVRQLREAWTKIHNTRMEELGLPNRIDHRTLDAQRDHAFQRGDLAAALDLDRQPQIRLGKAVHASNPDYAAFTDRRARNRAILVANKDRAAQKRDALATLKARADTAAYEEARQEFATKSLAELHATYDRPPPRTLFGRLKAAAFNGEVTRRALALSKSHGHPWLPAGHREGAPSILDALLPLVRQTGPGHPVFTVTAKDLAFAFYGMGFITQAMLQTSLEEIAQEEERLFSDRSAAKLSPWRRLSAPTRPSPDRPAATRLKQLRAAAPGPQAVYLKRLDQLRAFDARHNGHAQRREIQRAERQRRRARTVASLTSHAAAILMRIRSTDSLSTPRWHAD